MLRNFKQISKVVKTNSLSAPVGACLFHSSKAMMKPDNFMNGTNSVYLEQMYDNWVRDKKSVHASWDAYFSNVTNGLSADQAFTLPPTLAQGSTVGTPLPRTGTSGDIQRSITDSMKVFMLIKAYQRRGHELSDLDPLSDIFFYLGNLPVRNPQGRRAIRSQES